MTDYNDGKWHGWNGGECPVHPRSEIVVKWACNGVETNTSPAEHFNPDHWLGGDICAFRVVKEYRELREWWVTICGSYTHAHATKAAAETYSACNRDVSIIHVREVQS